MASGTADLQRDLGGAIMQSIFGALLTAGYAAAAAAAVSSSGAHVTQNVENELTKSFDGAESIAQQYPQHAAQITAGAKAAFLHGDQWAYLAGIVAVLLGAVVVFFFFPKMEREKTLLAEYHAADTEPPAAPDVPAGPPQPNPA
jgi:hypothetical protein